MKHLFFVLGFGAVGVCSRYVLGNLVARESFNAFPLMLFSINVAGAFLAGMVYVLGHELQRIPVYLMVGLLGGFLGGFTTFSSYCLEVARLFEQTRNWMAIFYFLISPAVGLAASFAGLNATRFLFR